MKKDNIDQAAIEQAAGILDAGGLVAFPTETVYGLGGNALDEKASQRIYAAKGRPSDNPLIVHIADMESLEKIVEEVPEAAKKLAKAYWPGPLTMIFKKSDAVPLATTGGLDSVAVRMPNHPVALALIKASSGYIAAPSANTSGRPSPTKAAHVQEDLAGRIDMILDGGDVGIGLESTIVDFTEEIPTILRPGYINQAMLEEVLGTVRMDPGLNEENKKVRPKAPGMRYKHYAPKGDLIIVEGSTKAVVERINALAKEKIQAGFRVGIIGTGETVASYPFGVVKNIGSRSSEETIARHLYGVLREFDEEGVDYIFSESFETPQMGQAIMNRLLKAAGHQVINVTDNKNQEEHEGGNKMAKTIVMDHPLIQHKIGIIRRKDTSSKEFREMISEIAMLICYEATRDLKLQDVDIETPICKMTAKELQGKKLAVVPILRAGLGMVEGMLAMIPAAKVGHIGLYRDPETLKPVEYYCKLPADCSEREVYVVDPMLATGGSASAAITLLKEKGVKNIHFMCILAAPEGIEEMQKAHPDVDLYIGAKDDHLNDHGYIVPGLGDAGDRIFGTK